MLDCKLMIVVVSTLKYYTRRGGIALVGDSVSERLSCKGDGIVSPLSRSSVTDRPGSESSTPSAVPVRAPAFATRSMGAVGRFTCPDLTLLFDTDSLIVRDG